MANLFAFEPVLLFLGPMELAIVGLIILVIVGGSRAPELAGKVGESIHKVEEPKRKLEAEIADLKGTPDSLRDEMGIDDDVDELKSGIEDVQEGLDPKRSPTAKSDDETPSSPAATDDNV